MGLAASGATALMTHLLPGWLDCCCLVDHVHGFLADAYASSPASLRQHVASQISLRLRHFTDKEGSPSQASPSVA